LFERSDKDVLTIRDAAKWASSYLKKEVAESNIMYLIQYGRLERTVKNGISFVSKDDLRKYYRSYNGRREIEWKNKLGEDINWALSFDNVREKERTKHVHRLHPYKGKFIPQLVEYFLDDHTDQFKQDVFFEKGDVILDPFCGSGTTLVQANELGMHGIGVDVSFFNCMIANAKTMRYDLVGLHGEIDKISNLLWEHYNSSSVPAFDSELLDMLYVFNNKYFPTPEFRSRVAAGEVDERKFAARREEQFLPLYNELVRKHKIKLKQPKSDSFLGTWYVQNARDEIDYALELIKKVKNPDARRMLSIILSRAIRSCRATTHSDLATLKDPQFTTYYCVKHKKICKPLFTITGKWAAYGKDTLRRLAEFDSLRSNTHQICIAGDSKKIDILAAVRKENEQLADIAAKKKIGGIFSSPPYVGLIDYHEQHAYAYELFGFRRRDAMEIGPMSNGQGQKARDSYVEGISEVLINCKKYLKRNANVLLVANDKYDLYPQIAERSGLKIVNTYRRPVLHRTERDKGAYAETVFHLR
jgi:hypothetical protein